MTSPSHADAARAEQRLASADAAGSHDPNAHPPADGDCNVLVAGLPREVDEVGLRAMFEPFGEVKRAIVMYKANTAQSRGFGFVLYGSEEIGQKAITEMDGKPCGDNVLSVRRSKHDGRVEESNLLFVRNVPKDVSNEWVVRTLASVLGAPPRITKVSAGSTASVVTVTLELESVDAAKRGIELLHLRPFATLYSKMEMAPPLPPVAEGRHGIPDMLVKFAESDQSRAERHSKSRAERTPAAPVHAPAPGVATASAECEATNTQFRA